MGVFAEAFALIAMSLPGLGWMPPVVLGGGPPAASGFTPTYVGGHEDSDFPFAFQTCDINEPNFTCDSNTRLFFVGKSVVTASGSLSGWTTLAVGQSMIVAEKNSVSASDCDGTSEGIVWSTSQTSNGRCAAIVWAVDGLSGGGTVVSAITARSGTNHNAPGVTVVESDSLVGYVCGGGGGHDYTAVPSGTTLIADQNQQPDMMGAYEIVGAGATGDQQFTNDSGSATCVTVSAEGA